MLENYLRPSIQKHMIMPAVSFLVKNPKITANKITLFSGIVGVLAALAISLQWGWFAVILLALSGYLDMLDGSLARMMANSSPVGAVLDLMMDRVVEVAVILALFFIAPAERDWVSLMMMASVLLCLSSFFCVGLFTENNSDKSFHYSPGIIERAEAFIFFAAMILIPSGFVVLGIIFSLLTLLTAGIRVYQFVTQVS